jgi:hypothetical protein
LRARPERVSNREAQVAQRRLVGAEARGFGASGGALEGEALTQRPGCGRVAAQMRVEQGEAGSGEEQRVPLPCPPARPRPGRNRRRRRKRLAFRRFLGSAPSRAAPPGRVSAAALKGSGGQNDRIDASAIVAILRNEPEADALRRAVVADPKVFEQRQRGGQHEFLVHHADAVREGLSRTAKPDGRVIEDDGPFVGAVDALEDTH